MSHTHATEQASVVEDPAFFGEADRVFGIHTHAPATGPVGALICLTPSLDESRVGARLARRLAAIGIPALRFDLEGHGDSLPARQAAEDGGFLAAAEWMKRNSAPSLVVVAGSAGARAALAAAAEIESLNGFVATRLSLRARSDRRSPTVGPVGRAQKALRRVAASRARGSDARDATWEATADPRAVGQLQGLIERGVPMLFVSGSEDTDYLRMQRQLSELIVDFDQTSIETVKVDARTLKDFRSIAGQSRYLTVVVDWARHLDRH